jgi:hypothetical protein
MARILPSEPVRVTLFPALTLDEKTVHRGLDILEQNL